MKSLADEYEREQRALRNTRTMNALLRGQRPEGDDDEDAGEPASMDDALRKAAGRPYKTKTKEEDA